MGWELKEDQHTSGENTRVLAPHDMTSLQSKKIDEPVIACYRVPNAVKFKFVFVPRHLRTVP